MNKIYDNGYRMLGQNKKLQEYFNKMLESCLDDLEKEYCISCRDFPNSFARCST